LDNISRPSVLALIPARGGSKGFENKNIKILHQKPMIGYTLDCAKSALNSGVIDKIIVSTDSPEIANVVNDLGYRVPFMRPAHLATDDATQMDVIMHAMEWSEENDKKYDYLLYLQPTSPLREPQDIKNAVRLLNEKQANAIVSVTRISDHHPLWMNTLPEDGDLKDFLRPEIKNTNRQELPEYYRLNGAIFIARWDYLKQNKDWYQENCFAYIMPEERSVDIDSEVDIAVAEFLLKKR
jgi:N-acylneuraminate cytidylyltransferase/CMP-N,N'-diacetyllegionaminic acid synthase